MPRIDRPPGTKEMMNASGRLRIKALAALALWASPSAEAADLVVADFEGDDYGAWVATGDGLRQRPGAGAAPGTDGGQRLPGAGARQLVRGRGRRDRDAHLASVHDPKALPQLPDRWRRLRGRDLPQPDRRRQGGPHRDRPQRQARRLRAARMGLVGRLRVPRKDRRRPGRRPPERGLGTHQRRPDRRSPTPKAGTSRPSWRSSRPNDFCTCPSATETPSAASGSWSGGATVREFDIKLASGKPDFWVFCDLEPFSGKAAPGRGVFAGRLEGARSREAGRRSPRRGRVVPRESPPAVPFHLAPGVAERPQRPGLARRRIPPFLSAQPLRLGLGEHALGPRRQPRPRPLEGTGRGADAPRVRRLVLLRQRRGRPGEYLGIRARGVRRRSSWRTRARDGASASPTATTEAGPGPSSSATPSSSTRGATPGCSGTRRRSAG